MTKSQNTKNEQQKDLCITSEKLTEQWKKGEIPNGYYWIRLSWGGMIIMAYYTGFDGLFELDDYYYDSDEISEVLAPVPSYEEYLSLTYAKEEDEKIIAEYEEENTKLKERNDSLNNRDINLCRIANGIRDENFSLKELLKECKEVIKNVDTYYGNYDSTNGYFVNNKINEVLK